MDFHFTARVEEEFDEIAEGKMKWTDMLEEFYTPFHKNVEKTIDTSERASGERTLGNDPETGKPVIVRIGRFGPIAQIGETNEETGEKPKFAGLRREQSIETITLQEALDLFKLPHRLGDYKDKEVIIGLGRFGPYVKRGEQYISIPRAEDPLKVDMDRAIQLITEKEIADAPIAHYKGQPVTKGKGRFGPFLKMGDLYVNVPRAYNFENLSQGDIEELIGKKLEKEANRYIQQWPEEKIAIENGRWGPFIRFGKSMLKLGRPESGGKYDEQQLRALTLDEVKKMISDQVPGAFEKKQKKVASRKPAAKKAVAKKSTASWILTLHRGFASSDPAIGTIGSAFAKN
jgi:DNA topoisomerase-1